MHARDIGYSPHDDVEHNFRNSLIEDYYESMDYINLKGGYCIRIGDKSMKPILKKEGYIDYALSDLKNEEMDLFLAANCSLFIGSASGALAMSGVFGTPLACANLAPLSHSFVRNREDMGIPKLYKNNATNELMNFKDIMQSESSNYRINKQFLEKNIILLRNSSEDILNMVKEQYHILRNDRKITDQEVELQKKI